MFKFLKRSYPFNDDLKHNTKTIFIISIAVFVFLVLFQPLGLNQLSFEDKAISLAGIVIVTFVSLSINLLLVPSLFSKFLNSDGWVIWKEVLWNVWILFTISAGYVGYYKLLGLALFDVGVGTVVKIPLLGIVPITFLISANQARLRKFYKKNALSLNQRIEEKHSLPNITVVFESEYQKDSLTVKITQLLNVSSAGNYIEVFWLDDENVLKKQMVRTSLLKAEKLLAKYAFIFKCHRSHLININFIDKVEGNYQGYRVFMHNSVLPIPISRNYIDKFQEII
ncbi:MAG: LytTR family DNA-binding domain-containing protein [Bacteroidota bacterium]